MHNRAKIPTQHIIIKIDPSFTTFKLPIAFSSLKYDLGSFQAEIQVNALAKIGRFCSHCQPRAQWIKNNASFYLLFRVLLR